MVKVDERSLGVEEVEVPHPASGTTVRPMRDMTELAQMLPQELLGDESMLLLRLASGDAMVTAYTQEREIFEDVFKERWEQRLRVLYVLLDVSPSMFPEGGEPGGLWRPKIWRPLVTGLLDHAVENEAIFLARDFGGDVSDLRRAVNAEQARALHRHYSDVNPISSTNIPRAIACAVNDFSQYDHDQAEIVIITDGENNDGINSVGLRANLEEKHIRLHAVLLGANNEALRAAAHRYQIVTEDANGTFVLHELVRNETAAV